MLLIASSAHAQSIAVSTCASFRDASKNPAQEASYLAYLQGYANASSPDPRFTQTDAALADDAKKVLDWCSKNSKSTFAQAVASALGPSCSAVAAPGPAASAEPTSCRVGPTNYCVGCSVTCNAPKQAKCSPGTDSHITNGCNAQSTCVCK
jgi:hypothetical protein